MLAREDLDLEKWDKKAFDVYIFSLLLAVFISVGLLFLLHSYLLLTNQVGGSYIL